jgi:putative ABC transport system permease protein
VNSIAVASASPDETRQRIDEIESLAPYTVPELVRFAEEANQTGVVIRGIMMSLTLTIAALFVANMLSRSVAERRLELATLKAIGMPSRTIVWAIAGEALLVCGTAFFVGITISTFFGYLINEFVAKAYGFESLYVVDAMSFVVVFVVALGLGLVAGLLPARQATKVDPIDVLREG